MKHLSYLLVSILSLLSVAACSQAEAGRPRDFTVTFSPVEAGGFIPLKTQKDHSLPAPVYAFTHRKNPHIHANAFRVGLLYRSKYGIELFYNFAMGTRYAAAGIEDYLAQAYPAYEAPKRTLTVARDYKADWKGWQGAVFYRIRLNGHLYLEPKLQCGFETFSQGNAAFYLKEKGSNQFTEYFVNADRQQVKAPSFHYILNTSWMLNPNAKNIKIEPGLKAEYFRMNVDLDYTITQSPYGFPDKTGHYSVNQAIRGLILALYLKMHY